MSTSVAICMELIREYLQSPANQPFPTAERSGKMLQLGEEGRQEKIGSFAAISSTVLLDAAVFVDADEPS
jgi:hypothetical protein